MKKLKSRLSAKYAERFWSKVNIAGPDDCWEWTASRDKDGYGRFCMEGRRRRANRIAYMFANGFDPCRLGVLHTCDNPACCNPNHLWLGTCLDNNKDRERKHRSADLRGENAHTVKLTEEQVRYIRQSNDTGISLANQFDVTPSNISLIRNRKNWRHLEH